MPLRKWCALFWGKCCGGDVGDSDERRPLFGFTGEGDRPAPTMSLGRGGAAAFSYAVLPDRLARAQQLFLTLFTHVDLATFAAEKRGNFVGDHFDRQSYLVLVNGEEQVDVQTFKAGRAEDEFYTDLQGLLIAYFGSSVANLILAYACQGNLLSLNEMEEFGEFREVTEPSAFQLDRFCLMLLQEHYISRSEILRIPQVETGAANNVVRVINHGDKVRFEFGWQGSTVISTDASSESPPLYHTASFEILLAGEDRHVTGVNFLQDEAHRTLISGPDL